MRDPADDAASGPTAAVPGIADPRTLLGGWSLSRTIEDRLAGLTHRVDGRLELTTVAPDRIHWAEHGRWHQAAGEVEVERNLWLVREADGGWWVRFADGREFHAWVPDARVLHDCAPDTYRGLVEGGVERWTVRWDVNGPRKDYTMTTVLVPEGR
jgi:hypothetical protein